MHIVKSGESKGALVRKNGVCMFIPELDKNRNYYYSYFKEIIKYQVLFINKMIFFCS